MKICIFLLGVIWGKDCREKGVLAYGQLMKGEYDGNLSTTRRGKTCMGWHETSPHVPKFKPDDWRTRHNHCRNPDNDKRGPWCYTTRVITKFLIFLSGPQVISIYFFFGKSLSQKGKN